MVKKFYEFWSCKVEKLNKSFYDGVLNDEWMNIANETQIIDEHGWMENENT